MVIFMLRPFTLRERDAGANWIGDWVSHRAGLDVMAKRNISVGFEVLTAVRTKMAVFWVVAPCSLVEVYQRFIDTHRPDVGGSKDL
jgi:hypothetical protein